MSSNGTAISVRGLSKAYTIAHNTVHATTMAEALIHKLSKPRQQQQKETFWALKDVSFDIGEGEVVGIIGRNGAGKSTLLKILSRITLPTAGRAEVYGRMGSLLEVGTGFHPELTGRENIYLNGAILGMRRNEITKQFDAIVDFAEVGQFIDTPVKRYSSGMYVRLAFAVAAHLNPEILIIDEVLAVGDANFQKKCLGKMGDIAQAGRTVLFVSHNMTAVQSLCHRAIWLNGGQVVEEGQTDSVVSKYLKVSSSPLTEQIWDSTETAPGNEQVRLRRISIRPSDGSPLDTITVRTSLVVEFEYWNLVSDAYLNPSVVIYNDEGQALFNTAPSFEPRWNGRPFPVGLFHSEFHIPGDLLNDGTHRIHLYIIKDASSCLYRYEDVLIFEVKEAIELRTGGWHGKWLGAVRPNLEWQTELIHSGVDTAFAG